MESTKVLRLKNRGRSYRGRDRAELKKEQENNSRTIVVEDRAVESGDIATIDFEGFVDGTPFEGGKGTDYPLTIGSNTFIPGFEDQLIGANTGR